MGNIGVRYKELRFLIEEKHTDVYVRVEADGHAFDRARYEGWHYKRFAVAPISQVLLDAFARDDPYAWPRRDPPDTIVDVKGEGVSVVRGMLAPVGGYDDK